MALTNYRILYDFEAIVKFNAGLVLQGFEVKSIRKGQVDFTGAYCVLVNNEIFLRNMYIARLKNMKPVEYQEKQDRKLLLTKAELKKIKNLLVNKNLTIVPLEIFDKRIIKLNIAVVRSKKKFDKRETIKKREVEKSLRRTEGFV